MSFVQIIEITTDDYAAMEQAHEQWRAATEGTRTVVDERICQDRDRPNTYVMIVGFPSYEAAMRNSELPATTAIAQQLAALSTAPPTFGNLDVLRVE